MTLSDADKIAASPSSTVSRKRQAAVPLQIHLTGKKLGSIVRNLLPFYGLHCPASIISTNEKYEPQFVNGTLVSVEGWATPENSDRSMLLLVG